MKSSVSVRRARKKRSAMLKSQLIVAARRSAVALQHSHAKALRLANDVNTTEIKIAGKGDLTVLGFTISRDIARYPLGNPSSCLV
jgi:hypothetical protein